ncbi:unnamed protein product [Lymnaea stagnalis]|uniref:Rho-GAP domain-containing protein n=1 Tax=Lymnaea stagnalis TaxID=6523 RepID=A0AAV2IHG9_LYMST
MVNILLLARLQSAALSARHIFTTAIRSNKFVCGANKCLGSLQGAQRNEENVETPQLRRSQAQSIWSILDLTSPTLGQLDKSIQAHVRYKILPPDSNGQVSESTSVWPSHPKIHQRVTLLNGLLGCGRPCLLSYIKHRLGPASLNYVGLNIVPSRTYVDLPDMPYPRDKAGYTLTWDLGREDKKKIQSIACDELQVLLKRAEVPFTLVKSWKKIKDNEQHIYKTPIESLVARDVKFKRMDDTHLQVPAVIKWMGLYIQEHGRTEGEVLKKNFGFTAIKDFMEYLEGHFYLEPESFTIKNRNYTVGTVGSAWKFLFLELPVPLMSSPKIEFFPEIYGLPIKDQVDILNLFILTMNPAHIDTLVYVVTILNHLTQIPETKMTASDFGQVFGPVLFKKLPWNMDAQEKETKQIQLNSATRMMIYYSQRMFVVPPNILTKLRENYDQENKSKSKSIFPWSKKKEQEEEPVAKPEGRPKNLDIQVFDVAASKTETITIDGSTTVGDVLSIYHGRRPGKPYYLEELKRHLQRNRTYVRLEDDGGAGAQAMDRTFSLLHEVGGNIGQRLLGFEVNIMDMLEINPNAKFEIRPNKQVFV